MRAAAGGARTVQILGTANSGSLPFLDQEAVVEVPCSVGPAGPVPVAVGDVPAPQRETIERLKAVERMTIRAARSGSRKLAVQALAMHPVVPSREVAERIFDGYAAGHPSLKERFDAIPQPLHASVQRRGRP